MAPTKEGHNGYQNEQQYLDALRQKYVLTFDWNEELVGSYPTFSDRQSYLDWTATFTADFATTGDANSYIQEFSRYQVYLDGAMPNSLESGIFLDERHLMLAYEKYGLRSHDDEFTTPTAYARHVWRHERAHQDVGTKWGLDSLIRLSFPVLSGKKISQAYISWDLRGMRKLAQKNQLQQAMGEILLAPEQAGVGYAQETQLGELLLAAANKRRR